MMLIFRKVKAMGLFDIFTFRKDADKIFSSENISGLFDLVKDKIIEQIDKKIKGDEKKATVDYFVVNYIREKVKGCTNKYVLWVVSIIIAEVPKITQIMYNFLKAKIENL